MVLFSKVASRLFLLTTRRGAQVVQVPARNAGSGTYWGYREPNWNPDFMKFEWYTRACGGFLWFWLLYHFTHDWQHLTGHFPYHSGDEWSNEELGIPPDEDGLAPTIPHPRTTLIPGSNPRQHNFPKSFLVFRRGDEGIYKF